MDFIRNSSSYTEDDYTLISDTERPHTPLQTRRRRASRRKRCSPHFLFACSRRKIVILLLSVPCILIFGILLSGIPPSFHDIRTYERRLPQHNVTASRIEGRKYIRFPNHLWGRGFNNVLQEYILTSYLAYTCNRTYVFEDYVWSHLPLPYTLYDFALRPVRMPLNAFISGPTAGGPLSPQESSLRAVSSEFWEEVCPEGERHTVSSVDAPSTSDGRELLEWWQRKLGEIESDCISVESLSKPVFDDNFFGGPQFISLWDDLSASPVLTDYMWSPLVLSAIARNFVILQPSSTKDLYDVSKQSVLRGVVAIHLRRGDYKRHCPRLAKYHATYMGFNLFPGLKDTFDATPYLHDNEMLQEYYLQHCWPSIPQIVEKLRVVRDDNPELKRVYVLTNGWPWWLNSLKNALVEDGWDDLKSTLDVVVDGEQSQVEMAVDMAIAEKAEVFVGNGFSSLTSNIIMLRLAKGLTLSTNRLM